MTLPIAYFRETLDEMKKVIWPSREDVIRLTAIVIMISIIVGLYIGALDYIFALAMELILR